MQSVMVDVVLLPMYMAPPYLDALSFENVDLVIVNMDSESLIDPPLEAIFSEKAQLSTFSVAFLL